ncbi:MAG: RNA polymerase sigma factor [Archangium sp.]
MNAFSRAELPREVVERACRGDRSAMSEVLSRYATPLHRLVRITLPAFDVDELTQALLARLVEVLPRFDPRGPATLTTWVFTVAHRFLLDERKRFRPKLVPGPDEPSTADDGAQHAWRTELRGALEAALGKLPEEQRRAVVLVHVFDHALEEVAQVEGVPVGTIKSRLFRARVALARDLGPQFGEELRRG